MTGWAKALTIIALVVVGMVCVNVAVWRRLKAALADRRAWTEGDFVEALRGAGRSEAVVTVVTDLIRPRYHAGVAPHPDDSLTQFLDADKDVVAEWVGRALIALGLPPLGRHDPERIAVLDTVADLGAFLDHRYRAGRPEVA